MATMVTKKQVRPISLPSTSRSLPSTSGVEQALTKFKTINISSESILMGLASLEELYDCTEEFLKMGLMQRVMSSDGSEFMEEMLDGSLRLMDICSASRDLMVETHEHICGIKSCVRRKKVAEGGEEQLDVAVLGYVGFRKNMRKEAKRLLGSVKKIDGKSSSCDITHQDEHLVAVIIAMRRVVSISVSVLKFFLEFLPGRQSNIKSKLASVLKKKKVHIEVSNNELETLDSAICGDLYSHDDLQKKLEEVEMTIGGFERNLEGLFRRLIRTRASLLNIISH